MARGIVIGDQTVPGAVGQTNPLPIRIKDGVTGTDLSLLQESTFTGRMGEVQATPTTYTVLGRLKDIYDRLGAGLPATLTAGGNLKAAILEALPVGTNAIGKIGHDIVGISDGRKAVATAGT